MSNDPDIDPFKFVTPVSKPDHDPHGEANPALTTWTCPNCGESGHIVAHNLEVVHEFTDVDPDNLKCEKCAPNS